MPFSLTETFVTVTFFCQFWVVTLTNRDQLMIDRITASAINCSSSHDRSNSTQFFFLIPLKSADRCKCLLELQLAVACPLH